jgi:hypothetical protein
MRMTESPVVRITPFIFLKDASRVILCCPVWLLLNVGLLSAYNAANSSLAPQVIKSITDSIVKHSGPLSSLQIPHLGTYILIAVALGVLDPLSDLVRSIYESNVVFRLQRLMLRRRYGGRDAPEAHQEFVARMVYDCLEAKRGLSPFFYEFWRYMPRLIATIGWQLTIAPAWLPALLITTAPALVGVILFTPALQRIKKHQLELNAGVAVQAGPDQWVSDDNLHMEQRGLLRQFVNEKLASGGMELVISLSSWPMLLALVLIGPHVDLHLLPEEVKAGEFAAFVYNMRSIIPPVRELGMIYTKLRGRWPAIVRVMYPHLHPPTT